MRWWEHVGYALTMTLTHKMRAFLTTLGVIIGIVSVTVMVSLGSSMDAKMRAELKERINLITVRAKPQEADGMTRPAFLTNRDVEAIRASQARLERISPELEVDQTVIYNAVKNVITVIGVTSDYYNVNKDTVEKGRAIGWNDVATEKKVAVISESVAKDFFRGADPLGKDIQIGNHFFTVVGVLKKKTTVFAFDGHKVLVPLSVGQNYFAATPENVTHIILKVRDYKTLRADKRELVYALLKSRGITDPAQADFALDTDVDFQKEVEKGFRIANILLGGIGAISLLVGGIGVMNIMLVSVTERTREIGIRKALGAKQRDILGQFLVESVVISAIGGIVGIVASYIVIFCINVIVAKSVPGNDETVFFVSLSAVFLAVGAALAVGVFFGVFPAYKASRLKPVEALRFE